MQYLENMAENRAEIQASWQHGEAGRPYRPAASEADASLDASEIGDVQTRARALTGPWPATCHIVS
jgi:hypothetical protein